MNKRIAAVAAVVALTGTLAFAGPHEGRGGHGRHGNAQFGARFAEKLNLTDVQKQEIRDIYKNSRDANKAFFETARADRKAAHEAKKANDTAKLDSLKSALEADRAQFKQIRAETEKQVLSVLTAEQRAQYETLKAEREARRAEHGKNGKRH